MFNDFPPIVRTISYIHPHSSFKKGEYQDAGKLYQKILPLAKNEKGQNNKIIGDIHVKLAAAYQSKGKLRASVDHLMLARGVYESIVEGNGENNGNTPNLESKIIEIMKTVASLQVATEQVEDADKSYRVSGHISIVMFIPVQSQCLFYVNDTPTECYKGMQKVLWKW